jgi:hypothetical protein
VCQTIVATMNMFIHESHFPRSIGASVRWIACYSSVLINRINMRIHIHTLVRNPRLLHSFCMAHFPRELQHVLRHNADPNHHFQHRVRIRYFDGSPRFCGTHDQSALSHALPSEHSPRSSCVVLCSKKVVMKREIEIYCYKCD